MSGCWQAQRKVSDVAVLNSKIWSNNDATAHDLVIVGPISSGKRLEVLRSLDPASAVIVCARRIPANWMNCAICIRAFCWYRKEKTGRIRCCCWRANRCAVSKRPMPPDSPSGSGQEPELAILGGYMTDMKHSMNNALTSMLGNAELLLLEPGQLSSQSLAQIKPFTAWPCASTKSCCDSHRWPARCARLRMLLKLRRKL